MTVLRTLFSALCAALAGLALLLALVCLLNPHRHQLYLIDIFSVPVMTGIIVLTGLLALVRQKWPACISGAALLIMLIAIWPQAFPRQAPADRAQPPVRLVFANMLIRNEEPEKLLPWIEKQNPDVVALLEVNPHARADLIAGLKKDRPYIATRYDMIVASRWPLGGIRAYPAGFALITTTVKAPQGNFELAVAHLTRPWPFTDPADQPAQFARLSRALKPLADDRFVLVGDFNTSPAAAQMRDFTRALDLHTAPAFRGTWPSVLPSPLRVTIDNAMASPDLNLSHRRTGPFDGSDHRPITVDIYPVKD